MVDIKKILTKLLGQLTGIGKMYGSSGVSVNITNAGAENYVTGATITVPKGKYVVIATSSFPSTTSMRAFRVRVLNGSTVARLNSITSSYWCAMESTAIVNVTADNTVLACSISCSITANGCTTGIQAVRIPDFVGGVLLKRSILNAFSHRKVVGAW